MFEIRVKITTRSSCLIGSRTGTFSVGGVDQSTVVDDQERPIIHASSFKGALRNIVREKEIAEEGMKSTRILMKSVFDEIIKRYHASGLERTDKINRILSKLTEYGRKPRAEYIFGVEGVNNMPRLYVTDFLCAEVDSSNGYFLQETKNSLEENNGSITSRPRTYRVIRPQVSFCGKITFHPDGFRFPIDETLLNEVKKELIDALMEFNSGFYRIGNSKSRGYGRIEVTVLEKEE